MLILIAPVAKPKTKIGQVICRKKVVVFIFERFAPKAFYYYSASHDFNLGLSKTCDIPDIHYELDTIKTGGNIWKYFPKTQVLLEKCIKQRNAYEAEKGKQDTRFKNLNF